MKVLLVIPPLDKMILDKSFSSIEEDRGFNPSLGVLYVAGYLEKHTNHEVCVIDAPVEELDAAGLKRRIADFKPDVVGITAMTMTLLCVLETASIVKSVDPGIRVVLGGPHVHLYPDETIRLPNIDFLVLGEGEEAFKELLDNIDDMSALSNTPGLVFMDGDSILNTGVRPAIQDLDALPFPARHLVPYKKYSSILAGAGLVTTIFTSRGCPYKCSFCDRPHLGKRFRARSAGNVVDEIQQCVEMGITEFLVYDDTFTVNKKRVVAICDEIVARGLKISFDVRARVDTVDDEVLVKLKLAGCQAVHYGIEAGTAKILEILNKGITIERARDVFAMTRKHGIQILAYFMIGSPTETREDILTTFKVMRSLAPDYVHLTVLTPFPGTEIYRMGLEEGVFESDVWRDFAKSPIASFSLPHWGAIFSKDELDDLASKGYRQFYLRPLHVIKMLAKIRSFSELTRKARAGLHVLGMK
ncbi:MAG: radical SAM protein [Kiritimatiellia bacterium]|jgi:radical SAM superfamily enzyme YgiQ (UPF0313 family)|nr:radical SAM protein [Kiritimatiellia bacterium]